MLLAQAVWGGTPQVADNGHPVLTGKLCQTLPQNAVETVPGRKLFAVL